MGNCVAVRNTRVNYRGCTSVLHRFFLIVFIVVLTYELTAVIGKVHPAELLHHGATHTRNV